MPTLQGYGPLGRVYFYPILDSNFIRGSRSRAHGDSPMFLNFCMGIEDQLDSDDSSEESWCDDSDSDLEGCPLRLTFPDYTERLPVLADLLCEEGPAWTPRDGLPHVTLIFHDSLPRLAGRDPAKYFDRFFLRCDNRQAWNVWVVGLDCFLGVRSKGDWDDLLLKAQTLWRSRIENPPTIKFLSHPEYPTPTDLTAAPELSLAPHPSTIPTLSSGRVSSPTAAVQPPALSFPTSSSTSCASSNQTDRPQLSSPIDLLSLPPPRHASPVSASLAPEKQHHHGG